MGNSFFYLNTKTKQYTTSSSVSYDPKTSLVYVSHFSDFAWVGKAISWLGRTLGIIPSLRNISYALFGKEILRFKWEIVVYIMHIPIYDTLVKDLRQRSYHECTNSPLRECIGVNGKVRLEIVCSDQWKVFCGGHTHEISTDSIWNAAVDAGCYCRFYLEAKNIVDTLECTVNALFIQAEQSPSTFLTVKMLVVHPLDRALISQPEAAGIVNQIAL